MARKYKPSIVREMHTALKIASILDSVGIKFEIRDALFSVYLDKRKCAEIIFNNKRDWFYSIAISRNY
jgi:hypothetical protein